MKAADVVVDREYAWKPYREARRVKVIAVGMPVQSRYTKQKGSEIEVLDDEPATAWRTGGPKGERRVVPNRELVGPWAEFAREEAVGEAARARYEAERAAKEAADAAFAKVWNDLMGLVAPEREETRFEDWSRRWGHPTLDLDPETAVLLAQRLTTGSGHLGFLADHADEIAKITHRRDQLIAEAEKEERDKLADLGVTEEEVTA